MDLILKFRSAHEKCKGWGEKLLFSVNAAFEQSLPFAIIVFLSIIINVECNCFLSTETVGKPSSFCRKVQTSIILLFYLIGIIIFYLNSPLLVRNTIIQITMSKTMGENKIQHEGVHQKKVLMLEI